MEWPSLTATDARAVPAHPTTFSSPYSRRDLNAQAQVSRVSNQLRRSIVKQFNALKPLPRAAPVWGEPCKHPQPLPRRSASCAGPQHEEARCTDAIPEKFKTRFASSPPNFGKTWAERQADADAHVECEARKQRYVERSECLQKQVRQHLEKQEK